MGYPHHDDLPHPEVDPLMPVNAPDWLWAAWEQHEIEWQRWEQAFAEIRSLPEVAEPKNCPDEEWLDD